MVSAYGKKCICSQGRECNGISSAFSILNDARKGYVLLPNLVKQPQTPLEHQNNTIRAAYLRHLTAQTGSSSFDRHGTKTSDTPDSVPRYVALHHFHPTVVEAHSKVNLALVPVTLKPADVDFLELREFLTEEDRVRNERGEIQDFYYFVPCYPASKVKLDLKRTLKVVRIVQERQESSCSSSSSSNQRIKMAKTLESIPPMIPNISDENEYANATSVNNDPLQTTDSRDVDTKATMDDELRKKQFAAMMQNESQRGATYESKWQDLSLRWRLTLETMQAGIFECARVERLMLGAVKANKAYGEAMKSIYEDTYVDDEFNAVTCSSSQSRLKTTRFTEMHVTDSRENGIDSTMLSSLILAQGRIADMLSNEGRSIESRVVPELKSLRLDMNEKLLKHKEIGDSLLREMMAAEFDVQQAWDSFCDSMRVTHHSPNMNDEPTFVNGCQRNSGLNNNADVLYQEQQSSSDGSQMISDDDKQTLLSTPAKSNKHLAIDEGTKDLLSSSPSPTPERSMTLFSVPMSAHQGLDCQSPTSVLCHRDSELMPESTFGFRGWAKAKREERQGWGKKDTRFKSSPTGKTLKTITKDFWMQERFYRSAVNFSAEVWKRCTVEMDELLVFLQRMETLRRMKIHQELLYFLPCERRLFSGLQNIMQPVITDLVGKLICSEFTYTIEDSIKRRIDLVKKEAGLNQSKILNRSQNVIPDVQELLTMFPQEFVDSDMLVHAKVVERRSGLRGQWRTTLLVITADKIMFLFDCKPFSSIECGTWPETAFKELLPTYEMPTMETCDPMPREDSLLKHLIPVASMNLVNLIASRDRSDPRVMDIYDFVPGYFRAVPRKKRFSLRTTGREETIYLLEILTENSIARKEGVERTSKEIEKAGVKNPIEREELVFLNTHDNEPNNTDVTNQVHEKQIEGLLQDGYICHVYQ